MTEICLRTTIDNFYISILKQYNTKKGKKTFQGLNLRAQSRTSKYHKEVDYRLFLQCPLFPRVILG